MYRLLDMIDSLIDGITMYRLILYYLVGLIVATIGLSIVGDMHYNPLDIAISSAILVFACWVINKMLAAIFDVPANPESPIITGLILALIIPPNINFLGILFLLAASGLAMASKYILTVKTQHIFNPAAIAVVFTAFGPRQSATWWVGSAALLPFIIIGGILITRKINREKMIYTFFIVTFIATVVFALMSNTSVTTSIKSLVLSSPAFFLGFVMLTEPLTSPSTEKKQMWYAALVGVLLPPQVHLFSLYSTPELSLIVGNIFSYIVSPKVRLFPTLKDKIKIATNTADFVFRPNRKFAYQPGQYMEWTLPHEGTDSRGERRYFTLASSPTESDIRIGVKFFDKGSSYKDALLDIDSRSRIIASQVSGDFVLPKNKNTKLVFIAGGIGVTPFRSMAKYLIDKNEKRSVVMLYGARTKDDIAYKDVFEGARGVGLKTIYVLSKKEAHQNGPSLRAGNIDDRLIQSEVPDYAERTFYISGTHEMVESIEESLRHLGVPKRQIKVDFFPGYM